MLAYQVEGENHNQWTVRKLENAKARNIFRFCVIWPRIKGYETLRQAGKGV